MSDQTINQLLQDAGYDLIHNVFGDNNKIILLKCSTRLGDEVYVKFDLDDPCQVRTHDSDVHFEKHETEIIHHEVKKEHESMIGDNAHGVLFECDAGICQMNTCKKNLSTESTTWIKKTKKSINRETHEYIVEKKSECGTLAKCPRKYPIVLYSEIKASPFKVALKVRKMYQCFDAVRTKHLFCEMIRFDQALDETKRKWCEMRKKIDCQLTMAVDTKHLIDRDLMTLYCMLMWNTWCDSDTCKLREKICRLKTLATLFKRFIDKCYCWINSVTSNADCLEELCRDLHEHYPQLCTFFDSAFNKACGCVGETSRVTFNPKTTIISERQLSLMVDKKMTAQMMISEGVTIEQLTKRGYTERDWEMSGSVLKSKMSRGVSPALLLSSGATLGQLSDEGITPYSRGQVLDTFEEGDEEMASKFRDTYNSNELKTIDDDMMSVLPEVSIMQ